MCEVVRSGLDGFIHVWYGSISWVAQRQDVADQCSTHVKQREKGSMIGDFFVPLPSS